MQGRRQPEREDEPAVTFELEETPQRQRGSHAGAIGAAAVAGAGLVSSALAPESEDSLDVFDQADDASEHTGDVPVTSFQSLAEVDAEPEFAPIDFSVPDNVTPAADDAAGSESIFGASADVGGGFVLDSGAADEAFGATDVDIDAGIDIDLVHDTLDDHDQPGHHLDGDLDLHDDVSDDIDHS